MDKGTISSTGIMHGLRDTNLTLLDTHDDIRGRKIHDMSGKCVGTVRDLIVEADGSRVAFVEVECKELLGLKTTHLLVPVESVNVGENRILYFEHNDTHNANLTSFHPALGLKGSVPASSTRH